MDEERKTNAPGPSSSVLRPSSTAAWLITKLVALLLLAAASGLLYHVATSDEFRITRVDVAGNQLLAGGELETAAAASGSNIFWIRQGEVTRRLQAIPAVQWARVSAFLPNRLEIRIGERTPAVIWHAAGTGFLVDREGRVLAARPSTRPLTTIRDTGPGDFRPGSTVDPDAIETVARLEDLLPRVGGTSPREFEYSAETGVTVTLGSGPRIRFGNSADLPWKITALIAIRRELERTGQQAELIDLRFKDRPYIR